MFFKYLLPLVFLLPVLLPANGQNADARLLLTFRNARLQEFVRTLENSTGYTFIYSSKEIVLKRRISLKAEGKTLREILTLAFRDEAVDYRFSGRYIFLQQRKEPAVTNRRFTINGHVTDSLSSETLIGANIFDTLSRQGTSSNSYGFYSITLPEGQTTLRFSYLGYAAETRSFSLVRDTVLNIRLRNNAMLKEVTVLSDKAEAGVSATQMGTIEIPAAQIKNTPSLLGEADVIKTLQLMPGVQAGLDGSAGMYVRGGGPDQNLILLDGTPVYNTDHLFGFFSVFTPEAVKKVTLFKSSFPAQFGSRLSSVVDVRTNDGDMHRYHGTFSIGLLSSKLHLEGPIVKGKTSFSLSARRSYLDLVARPFMPEDDKYSYYFYDVNAKLNHRFSDRSRLFLTFYNGKDRFSASYGGEELPNGTKIGWGSTIVSVRWNYIFNNRLFSNTTVAFNDYQSRVHTYTDSRIDFDFDMLNHYQADYRSGIGNWSYQIDFDYRPNPTHHIKFGTGYLYHRFRPEVMTTRITDKTNGEVERDTLYNSVHNSRIYGHEVTAYAENNIRLTSRLRLNAGLRLSLFHVQRRNYFSCQPRLSARYQLYEDVALKASYTQMSQYVHLLSSTPFSMPTDLWVPITRDIKPMYSHQYAAGGYYTGLPGWEFSAEGYYKKMRNVLEYKDGVSFLGSSTRWEDKVETGIGRSFGMELMAQKTTGRTTGWLSYTLAKTDRQFAKGGINNGERFPYKYDRCHHINLTVNHRFNDQIDIGASWVFYTGGTVTIPEEKTAIIRPEGSVNSWYGWGYGDYFSGTSANQPSVSEASYVEHRNNYRLPSSHRLNVGINFRRKTTHGIRTWNISLYNVYNAMNPAWIYRSHSEKDWNKSVIKKYTLLPLIPSFSYTYQF